MSTAGHYRGGAASAPPQPIGLAANREEARTRGACAAKCCGREAWRKRDRYHEISARSRLGEAKDASARGSPFSEHRPNGCALHSTLSRLNRRSTY